MREGLVVQGEVVNALILRELRTRYGDSELSYLWAFLDSAMMIAFMWLMRFGMRNSHPPPGMDMMGFLATGVLGYHMVVDTMGRAASGIKGNAGLIVYPQIKILDLVIARAGLEMLTLITVFTTMMLINGIALRNFHIDDFLQMSMGLGLAAWLGTSLGLFFSCVEVVWETAATVRTLIMRPMIMVSGVFFTASELPVNLRHYLVWNPILHVIEIVRSGWFGAYESTLARPSYVIAWCVLISAIGLMAERFVRDRLGDG